MPKYIMLIGLPGSGKSTWVKNFLKNAKEKYVIISSDDIIEELGGLENLSYADAFKKYSNIAMKEMFRRFSAAIANKANIIHDQTNLTKKTRLEKLSKIPAYYKKEAVVFHVDDVELQKRLEKRLKEINKKIPNHVMDSMKNSYEPPTKEEGFDEITNVK